MIRTPEQLRQDALAIWRAGVAAVHSDRLVQEHVHVDGEALEVAGERIRLNEIDRLVVVGAGKAGAGMAAGLEAALGERVMADKQLAGWVNVPADCVRPLQRIVLHAARPAGVNEPTEAGVRGAERILELVGQAKARDVVLCLISGGGSALLPAPAPGITLADKLAVTQVLSAAGANIQELNTVRKQLSRIKGQGLARACRAGRLIALIISDVLGDPLDIIASGPTVADSSTPALALEILERFQVRGKGVPERVFAALQARKTPNAPLTSGCRVSNHIIGNNATAVDAAGVEAERRGYSHAMVAARELEGEAEAVGRHHAQMAQRMRTLDGPDCLITGGEPVVRLVAPGERGRGGRNQQLVLAALEQLLTMAASPSPEDALARLCLLAGGTDGEDGPTDAAGAWVNESVAGKIQAAGLQPGAYLRRNDAYSFFEQLGSLLKTGPTHTNVGDLRVITVSR